MAAETLLLDIGNTRLKWALLEQDKAGAGSAVVYRDANLTELLSEQWRDLHPSRVIACSVASATLEQLLTNWTMEHWGISPFYFTSKHPFPGMRTDYRNPLELGNDRWLAAIAAFQHCKQAVAVVDAGTAITIDLVNAGGHHRGGWILPGIETMARCLKDKTAIAEFSITPGAITIATNTSECINNGSMLACTGAIESAAARLAAIPEWQSCHWLLTGGNAEHLSAQLELEHEQVENLLLDGLALIANQGT